MKIVYTYRVVCQKLSAPELGPTLPTAFWPRGISAAASRSYSLSPTYRWIAPSSRPSHAAAPPPSSTPATCWTWSRMPSAGKAFRPPKAPTRGEVRPFAGCPIAQGTPLTYCSRQAQSLPGCVCRSTFYAAIVTCLSAPAHTPACQKITFVAY